VVVPLRWLRLLVLPALAALIFLVKVMELDVGETSVRVVETLLWLCIIHVALSFLNVVLFAEAKEDTWQAKVPRLFIDLTRGLVVLVCTAIVLSTVWGLDLGQLATALGVGGLVLGLALQDPLGNLFSGIVLLFERPLQVGHWVRIGDTVGTMVEANWRAVHLMTRAGDLHIVPNSVLAKESFVNYSRPNRLHGEAIKLSFSCDDPPNKVKRTLIKLALDTPGVLANPAPTVWVLDHADFAIVYLVTLRVDGFEKVQDVVDEFLARVWYAAKREGLTIPYPTQSHIVTGKAELDATARGPLPAEELEAFPRFGLGNGSTPAGAVARSAVAYYARGEKVVNEGENLPGLLLILKGQVLLTTRDVTGKVTEVSRLERGEFFGEKALLSSGASEVTVTALDDLELLMLDSETLHVLLERAPQLAREIGGVMEDRRKTLRAVRAARASAPAAPAPSTPHR